jgi:hypothetical protein
MRIPTLLCLSICLGCRPDPAPQDLDLLSSYLFGHVWTDDPAELEDGLDNLRVWLKNNLEETEDGFEVKILNQKQVDSLDNCKRDISGLVGTAVSTRSNYAIEELVRTDITVPPEEVYSTSVYSRRMDFTPDRDCFLDQECERLQYRTISEAIFAGFLTVRSKNGIQHRWVETEQGTASVFRSWLQKPAIVSVEGFHVDTQFYLSAAMPWEGGTIRLQATWAATELENLPVPESFALNQAIKTMRDADEELTEYLEEQ